MASPKKKKAAAVSTVSTAQNKALLKKRPPHSAIEKEQPPPPLVVVSSAFAGALSVSPIVSDFADHARELPDRYNETCLTLMERDPEWCFAYWDISDEDRSRHATDAQQLHIHMYRLLDSGNQDLKFIHADIEIACHYGSWYIMLGMPDNYFFGELGFHAANGTFIVLARSRVIHTARASFSDSRDDDWIPIDAFYETDTAHAVIASSGDSGRFSHVRHERFSSDSISFGRDTDIPGRPKPEDGKTNSSDAQV
ncbi:MAG: DUF4912 domain-containing protein [Spirochaetota bacterium]